MQPEWLFGMGAVLAAILANVSAKNRRISTPKLTSARYAELSSLLTDEEAIRYQLCVGNKISAIKLYRQQTNIGLKEAKEAVEMMQEEMRQAKLSELANAYKSDTGIEYMLLAGNEINAIKIYRQQNGVGLKEAKDAVERMMIEGPNAVGSNKAAQPSQGQIDPNELQRLIGTEQKIQAIQYYRETTGANLKEAKGAVDWLVAHMEEQHT